MLSIGMFLKPWPKCAICCSAPEGQGREQDLEDFEDLRDLGKERTYSLNRFFCCFIVEKGPRRLLYFITQFLWSRRIIVRLDDSTLRERKWGVLDSVLAARQLCNSAARGMTCYGWCGTFPPELSRVASGLYARAPYWSFLF